MNHSVLSVTIDLPQPQIEQINVQCDYFTFALNGGGDKNKWIKCREHGSKQSAQRKQKINKKNSQYKNNQLFETIYVPPACE